MREWHIGLDPWIIQDGNYEDFRCGEIVDFALEFYPESLRVTTDERSEANRVTDCKYRVGAEVVLSTGKVLVIDFGVRAYREGSQRFRRGSFVEGEIQVGIDPFMYFEWLSKSPRIPPLIYGWRIEQIQKLSAPLIEGKGPDGLRALVWDES